MISVDPGLLLNECKSGSVDHSTEPLLFARTFIAFSSCSRPCQSNRPYQPTTGIPTRQPTYRRRSWGLKPWSVLALSTVWYLHPCHRSGSAARSGPSHRSIVRDGLLAATVLMMIWTVFGVLEGLLGVGSWPKLTLTMGQLIAGAGILMTASGLVYWICRSSFSVDQKKSHWVILFLILFVLLCLGVFLRQPIAVIPVTAIVVFIVVLFLVYKLLDSRLD